MSGNGRGMSGIRRGMSGDRREDAATTRDPNLRSHAVRQEARPYGNARRRSDRPCPRSLRHLESFANRRRAIDSRYRCSRASQNPAGTPSTRSISSANPGSIAPFPWTISSIVSSARPIRTANSARVIPRSARHGMVSDTILRWLAMRQLERARLNTKSRHGRTLVVRQRRCRPSEDFVRAVRRGIVRALSEHGEVCAVPL